SRTGGYNGPNLTTSLGYYAPANGQPGLLNWVVGPDGTWRWFTYDSSGRVTAEYGPGDGEPFANPPTLSAAHAMLYDYNSVDPAVDNLTIAPRRPRTVTERLGGIDVAKTLYAYWQDGSGRRVSVTERCATPTAAYGGTANFRTVVINRPNDRDRVEEIDYAD